MKNKILIGLVFGAIAGIIDVTPMIIQKLPLSADLSAFVMWTICGFFISVVSLNIHSILKGLLISYLMLLPCLIIIVSSEPLSFFPIFIMTSILGSALGYTIERVSKKLFRIDKN